MLKPRYNKVIYKIFEWYIARIIGTDFKNFVFDKVVFDPNRSILILCNHFSWWDGFFILNINRLYFKKNFHVMITEENYRKVWFLKYLGCFSVKKNSRSMIESLNYSGELLNNPDNLVLIFPQGKLHSNHLENITFEKGLMNLINSSNKKFQYIFAVILSDFFQNRKPSIFCYLHKWEAEEFISLQLIKNTFNKHYESSRQQQSQITV
ncbi:MAG: lysophospholipid acyltransferase family protein [Flavobacterium sp.]|nr:lysophospholipid acyltransferase family protein [Pedobacter sp.]